MKRHLIPTLALTLAAGAVSAATFSTPIADFDPESLTPAQKAQVFAVINNDESRNTQQRMLEAILGSDEAPGTSRATTAFEGSGLTVAQQARIYGILDSDANLATQERLIEAALDETPNSSPEVAALAAEILDAGSDD